MEKRTGRQRGEEEYKRGKRGKRKMKKKNEGEGVKIREHKSSLEGEVQCLSFLLQQMLSLLLYMK